MSMDESWTSETPNPVGLGAQPLRQATGPRITAIDGIVKAVINSLWPNTAFAVEPVREGMSNHNYTVRVNGAQYFAQFSAPSSEEFSAVGASRSGRVSLSRKAHELGIGPAVIADGEFEGYQFRVSDFAGASLSVYQGLLPEEAICALGRALSVLHGSAPVAGAYSWAAHPTQGARRFCDEMVSTTSEMRQWRELTLNVCRHVDSLRNDYPLRPVHVDLVPENILWDGHRIYLVDWEYSGMGDPLYDLADFLAKNRVSEGAAASLVHEWGGRFEDVRRVLLAYLPLAILREAVWACRALELGWRDDVDYFTYAAGRASDAERLFEQDAWPF